MLNSSRQIQKSKHCKGFWKYPLNGNGYYFAWDEIIFSKQPDLLVSLRQSWNEVIKVANWIRLKWNVPWFFCWPNKFSLSQCRCLKTPIDVENCVKSALNSKNRKQNFTVITKWGGGNYQLRSALAAKHIWVAVITIVEELWTPPLARYAAGL